MKKKSSFRSTLFYLRVLVGFTFCLIGFFLALFAFGGLIGWHGKLQAGSPIQIGRGPPNIQVVRPIKVNKDLRELSYIAPYAPGIERPELRRYPPGTGTPLPAKAMTPIAPQPAAPGVNIGFDGIDRNASVYSRRGRLGRNWRHSLGGERRPCARRIAPQFGPFYSRSIRRNV